MTSAASCDHTVTTQQWPQQLAVTTLLHLWFSLIIEVWRQWCSVLQAAVCLSVCLCPSVSICRLSIHPVMLWDVTRPLKVPTLVSLVEVGQCVTLLSIPFITNEFWSKQLNGITGTHPHTDTHTDYPNPGGSSLATSLPNVFVWSFICTVSLVEVGQYVTYTIHIHSLVLSLFHLSPNDLS
jgi:hypothetical protein